MVYPKKSRNFLGEAESVRGPRRSKRQRPPTPFAHGMNQTPDPFSQGYRMPHGPEQMFSPISPAPLAYGPQSPPIPIASVGPLLPQQPPPYGAPIPVQTTSFCPVHDPFAEPTPMPQRPMQGPSPPPGYDTMETDEFCMARLVQKIRLRATGNGEYEVLSPDDEDVHVLCEDDFLASRTNANLIMSLWRNAYKGQLRIIDFGQLHRLVKRFREHAACPKCKKFYERNKEAIDDMEHEVEMYLDRGISALG